MRSARPVASVYISQWVKQLSDERWMFARSLAHSLARSLVQTWLGVGIEFRARAKFSEDNLLAGPLYFVREGKRYRGMTELHWATMVNCPSLETPQLSKFCAFV